MNFENKKLLRDLIILDTKREVESMLEKYYL